MEEKTRGWLDTATKGIRFGPDRRAVRKELADHLEDKHAALCRAFPDIPPEEAEQRALDSMGDPAEIGRELARLHRPWLGYLWRASQVLLALCLLWTISVGPLDLWQGRGAEWWDFDDLPSFDGAEAAQARYLPGEDPDQLLALEPELEQAASEFLWEKYLSNDPLKMYVAFRIWNSYLLAREPRDRNAACDRFMDKMSSLTGVFHNETMSFDRETGKPKHFQAGSLYFKGAPSEDTRLDLWFPDNRHTEECVSAYASLYPLITYYLNRLNDWGLCFRRCKVCGKYFLAKSQRYELCSDKCRKAQALQNKREFDERARENNYDLLYKNECQNWRNKINRVKNTAGFPADRLEKIQAAFSDFKKEALQRKKAVKTGTASPKEFTDWLYQQSNVIVELLTEY